MRKKQKQYSQILTSHQLELGQIYLGSFIGTEQGKEEFIDRKVEEWCADLFQLACGTSIKRTSNCNLHIQRLSMAYPNDGTTQNYSWNRSEVTSTSRQNL